MRRVSAPSALILRPLVYHSFYSESEDADRACLLFDLKKSGDGEAFDEYSKLLSSLPEHTVIPEFSSCFSKFRSPEEHLRPFERNELLKNELSGALVGLFSRLREMREPSEGNFSATGRHGILADIFKYIEDNFAKDPTPRDLASSLYISQRQLERLLKDEMGTTFTGLLNKCRIENVCKQLDKPTDRRMLAQLAEESGFPDYSTFWRNFKKYTGKSPTEYTSFPNDPVETKRQPE